MSQGSAPRGGAAVLDVAQLEALLSRTFSIGLDVGWVGRRSPWSGCRLSKALLGAAETQAMAAEALAIEQGMAAEQMRGGRGGGAARRRVQRDAGPGAGGHLAAHAMGVVTGLAALEPDPRAPGADMLLDAARQAATGLQQLLAFRHD